MTGRTRVVALAVAALAIGACSDEPPPDWLQGLADEQVTVPSTTTTVPPPTTTTTVPQTVIRSLEAGTCLEDVDFAKVSDLKAAATTPCRRAHDAEIYAVLKLKEGRRAKFPGPGNLNGRANERCRDRFERFVGVPFTKSSLDIVTLRPKPDSWSEGDRAVVCIIADLDEGPLEGSARGSKA